MTRKEAIEQLDDLRICFGCFKIDDAKALSMTIDALKQIKAIEDIINVSNLTIQEDVLKYKMILDIIKGIDDPNDKD